MESSGLRPGDLIAQRFRIASAGSSGGMGRVYRAIDEAHGEAVALKVLLEGVPEGPRLFAHEIAALSRTSHPRIVRFVASGTCDAGPYFVMEWLEGDDLRHRLASGKRMRVADTVALGVYLGEALAHAHARGIVHRDVKPGNVVFVASALERARLVDFGLATLDGGEEENDPSLGTLVGTPGYMAPEQALGQKVDGRADVFALGCVLYKALVGRAPFAASDAMASIARALFDEPLAPSTARTDVPFALDALVLRMLSKNVEHRPTSDAVVEALRAIDVTAPVARLSRPPALTDRELRIVSVLVAGRSVRAAEESTVRGAATPMPLGVAASLRAEAAKVGARVEIVGDMAIATLSSRGNATEQAARAARLALALHAVIPDAPMALATGRAEVGARVVGDVIDRAVERVRAAPERSEGALVDEVTAGLLGPAFEVRGESGALVVVREREPDATPVRTLLGKPSPLFGREAELARLDAALAACASSHAPHGVVVVAAGGVGKSRLRHEWIARGASAAQVMFARADPMTAASPHGLLAQLLRGAASIDPTDSPEAARARLRGRIARSVAPAEVKRVAEFLGEVLGIPFVDEGRLELRAARQDPMIMSDQIRRAWESFVHAESATSPLVLVLEDVHWADAATMRLVDWLVRGDKGASVLVLMLTRPDALASLEAILAAPSVERIDLAELDANAQDALARFVLGDRADEPRVRASLEKAAGNAFFLEEILRAIALGKGDDVPETVLAIVEQRLERLDAEARRVLRAASVYGQAFWDDGVAALVSESTADVKRVLDVLAADELLGAVAKTRLPGQRELRFRHALVRDAAYATLTEEDRASGHARAGAWLEAHGEWDAATLAEHYELGKRPARALAHYRRAAIGALDASDLSAVIDLADRGMRCSPSAVERGELQRARAEALRWRGKLAEAETAATDAVQTLPVGSTSWCKAAAELATAAAGLGHIEIVRDVGKTLLESAAAERADALTIALARVAGQLHAIGARTEADGIVAALETRPRSEPLAQARTEQAYAYRALYSSDIGSYYEHMSAARRLFESVGDRRNACVQAVNMGYVAVQAGAFDEAEEALASSLATAVALGIERTRAIFLHNFGLLRALQGRVTESIALQLEALAVFSAQGDRRLEAFSRMYLSGARAKNGELDEAMAEARRAVEVAGPMLPAQASARSTLADALLQAGRNDEALAEAQEAYAIMVRIGGIEDTESLVRVVYAEALVACGREDEARVAIADAVTSLHARAAKIRKESWRASFLTRMPENARTLALAAKLGL